MNSEETTAHDRDHLDEENALALADPDDYTLNRRAQALYKKREEAYDALTDWPARANDAEWDAIRREAGVAAANYAMDCLELADRLDIEITVDGPHAEKFEKVYPGGVRTFATYGGTRIGADEGTMGPAKPTGCRVVITACDRFLGKAGLGGKVDPGLDDDLL